MVGSIIVGDRFDTQLQARLEQQYTNVVIAESEIYLISELILLVNTHDPDILTGYEIEALSWGYLNSRMKTISKRNLADEISRLIVEPTSVESDVEFFNTWGYKKASTLDASGRIFINCWKTLKSEVNLTSYTLENTAFHVLHLRIPRFTSQQLSAWFEEPKHRYKVLDYYTDRVQYTLELLDDTNFISKTTEFARVYGVDFYSIVIRGSQFKVESLMCRVLKPECFVCISPSNAQVRQMRAAECLPLVMEPHSRYYKDPVLVLDFQSLYPSIMIAYNYCYSTCLGRVVSVGEEHQFGVLNDFKVSIAFVKQYKEHLNISPNGLAFVKPIIRDGVVKRMLAEILETRVMVKQSMKFYRDDKGLSRVLDMRQMGLKLISNVTYGYIGASYSGRMPCVDIADAIVQTGRATLEKAIETIHATKRWNAEVVYGDTDSLFVHLPGLSRESAFALGEEIAGAISRANPFPMKLKFEKVYLPCFLLTKKRYTGMKQESITDTPVFEAKGIETVRRDGCPAVAKMMEKCLRSFFLTADLSQLKAYLYRQWTKILNGDTNTQDFIIAKEVKLGSYTNLPPGAVVSIKKMMADPRNGPQHAERVPYLIVYGNRKDTLSSLAVSPDTFLSTPTLQLNGHYYITKHIIPALSRIFNLVGADLESWWRDMPKPAKTRHIGLEKNAKAKLVSQFYQQQSCLNCNEFSERRRLNISKIYVVICHNCADDPVGVRLNLLTRHQASEKKCSTFTYICNSCASFEIEDTACVSLDCNIRYARTQALNKHLSLQQRYQNFIQ